jgi:hypothetical protein
MGMSSIDNVKPYLVCREVGLGLESGDEREVERNLRHGAALALGSI